MIDPEIPERAEAIANYRLGYQLRLSDMALRRATEEKLRPLGLNPPQVTALLFIDRFPEVTMARLAILSTVTPQTMHRTVTALLERMLVERVDKPDDRKSFGLVLTASGRTILGKGEAIMRAVQDIANAAFTSEERQILHALLERYEAALAAK